MERWSSNLGFILAAVGSAVGRHLRSSVVSSFALAGEKLKIFGWLICLIVLLRAFNPISSAKPTGPVQTTA